MEESSAKTLGPGSLRPVQACCLSQPAVLVISVIFKFISIATEQLEVKKIDTYYVERAIVVFHEPSMPTFFAQLYCKNFYAFLVTMTSRIFLSECK